MNVHHRRFRNSIAERVDSDASDDAGGYSQNRRPSITASKSTTPATRMITQNRTVRGVLSIAYRTTVGHPSSAGSRSCFLTTVLTGDGFTGLCAVIVPSCGIQRKTPRCPTGEDACPREVPIPRYDLSRAVAGISQMGARRAATTEAPAPARTPRAQSYRSVC